MKKIIMTCAALLAATTMMTAQTIENSKLTDNWYLGGNIGAVTPLNGAFFGNMRPTVGLEVGRYLTPVFGLGLEGRAKFNTTPSHTAVDQAYALLLGKFNLNNLFSGYKGEPRAFEVVAVAGTGFEHQFGGISDKNYMAYKAGMEFNFNLGQAKAWQINIKPAIVWDLDRTVLVSDKLDKNAATFELNAGLTYKFGCSNGTHNFAVAKIDQSQLEDLNNTINRLRSENEARANSDAATIENLKKQLNDCQNAKPAAAVESKNTPEAIVTFRQGKSNVEATQLPNIDKIATYLKNNESAKVVIKGYASPEGGAKINQKISESRANAVKNILVSKYNISADRIETEGCGIGNTFSKPAYNRVSICTVNE